MQDEQKFIQILASLCGILNNHKVRYLVVGGAAVNAHGHYRPTTDREGNAVDNPDFDFWFHPLYLNYTKLLDAFDDMSFDTSRFREEAHPFPKVLSSVLSRKDTRWIFCRDLVISSAFGIAINAEALRCLMKSKFRLSVWMT